MNKIERIKAEIEKRMQELRPTNTHKMQVGKMDRDVLMWLNALTWVKKVINSLEEEPVSNDLEEAAHSYVDTAIEWFDSEGNPCCYPAFIAGAQWQKQQKIEKAVDYIANNMRCDGYTLQTKAKFIKDFKKAMEE